LIVSRRHRVGGRWHTQGRTIAMSTEYMNATTDAEREALARRIARLRQDGAPWDGPGGIVDSMHLVSSATEGRALLRKYKLDAKSGGLVEIAESYDRFEINPRTGRRKGYREKTAGKASRQKRSDSPTVPSAETPRPANTLDNLVTLCVFCHADQASGRVSSLRSAWRQEDAPKRSITRPECPSPVRGRQRHARRSHRARAAGAAALLFVRPSLPRSDGHGRSPGR
jgi:hypothetical protein